MTYLCELDLVEDYEPLPCDALDAAAMERGSFGLLSAICEARGLEAPERPRRQRDYICIEHIDLPEAVPHNPFMPRVGVVPRLIDSVADDFGISHGELIGEGRAKVYVHARTVVIRLLLERGYSSASIGHRFLRRDHSTILWSRDQFDIYARANPLVAISYERHAQMMGLAA